MVIIKIIETIIIIVLIIIIIVIVIVAQFSFVVLDVIEQLSKALFKRDIFLC